MWQSAATGDFLNKVDIFSRHRLESCWIAVYSSYMLGANGGPGEPVLSLATVQIVAGMSGWRFFEIS